MAPIPNQYGSISQDDKDATLELLPHGPSVDVYNRMNSDASNNGQMTHGNNGRWTRHHCISYLLAAGICLFAAHYWHDRADSLSGGGSRAPDGVIVHQVDEGRVPMPPALSTLDPRTLKFRSVQREGLASPSEAWGGYLIGREKVGGGGDEKEESSMPVPLPTNEWYLNLLSHKAANDPSTAGEVAHVYTIPYILGVSPPSIPDTKAPMAGIELFVPSMKTGSTNMQMVFDKNNGMSLGALVTKSRDESSSLTSYQVDSSESISPLGVSLKWNHVNMKTHIVRGMPYGTVRFGKDDSAKKNNSGGSSSFVLPTILSGARPKSILIDSDEGDASSTTETVVTSEGSTSSSTPSNEMLCGTFNGESVEQDPARAAPITSTGKPEERTVRNEIIFHMDQSDFTWIVFFSKPVKVKCYSDVMPMVSVAGPVSEVQFRLDVTEVLLNEGGKVDDEEEEELVVRIALLNECTTGNSVIKEHCDHLASLGYDTISSKKKAEQYLGVLRKGKNLYAKSPLVGAEFPKDEDEDEEGSRVTNVVFDWDVTSVYGDNTGENDKSASVSSMTASSLRTSSSTFSTSNRVEPKSETNGSFFMFALPHHLKTLTDSKVTETSSSVSSSPLCIHTFHGRTCLVEGPVWNLPVSHGKPHSFLADRPPVAKAIPALAEAVNKDITFDLSSNIFRGAADTYFLAKILAKVGRIIEITKELQNLQSGVDSYSYTYPDADESTVAESAAAAAAATLPSESEVEAMIADFQSAVEIWLKPGGKENKGGEAEFLYDESWGGFVNCGCNYTFEEGHEGEGTCSNSYPECPAIDDVNIDFGNGWYNDHHFHYGYMIYAAAIVAKHRPEWGREYYDRVLLYIRDIANPSAHDKYFPMYRQKDWYLGNSWAAGLMSMELSPHGREQESSSEAIAAFEGIALFGSAMMDAFEGDDENLERARLVRNLGEFLTSMEVDAANRYYHVWGLNDNDAKNSSLLSSSNGNFEQHINTYPSTYEKPVVGMMHETMASFQTWFSNEDVVSYGIQLMPLTAVAERRDDPEWVNLLYPIYDESCKAADEGNDGFCTDNGWSIIQSGLLAETGDIDKALDMASEVDEKIYLSDGACGNSLTNTLWFISTRKVPSEVEQK